MFIQPVHPVHPRRGNYICVWIPRQLLVGVPRWVNGSVRVVPRLVNFPLVPLLITRCACFVVHMVCYLFRAFTRTLGLHSLQRCPKR